MLSTSERIAFARLVIAFAIGGVGTIAADGQETLRWKFKAGDTLRYNHVETKNVTTTVMGRNRDSKRTQTMDMVWKVANVDKDGTAELALTFTRIRFVMTGGPIGKTEYDSKTSKKDGAQPPVDASAKIFNALVGNELTMTMTALGEIKEVKLPKKLVNSIQAAAGKTRARGLISPVTIKEMIGKAGIVFPKSEVKPGETWKSGMKLEHSYGTIAVNTKYKYLKKQSRGDKPLAKIEVTPRMAITTKPGAPFTIKYGKQSGGGTVLFDITSGRLNSSSIKGKIAMQSSFGARTLEQTIDTHVEMKLSTEKRDR